MEKYKVVNTKSGIPSILFLENGEIMHNPVGPWQESHQLYLEPMQFKAHLRYPFTKGKKDPLVVFDVGLGAGTNAIAAMSAWEPGERDLKIISFEKDLDLLQFALDHRQEFSFLQGFKKAIQSILEKGVWQSPGGQISWELRLGDFNSCIERETHKAELIFFDPYSPKKNPEMWSLSCFEKLYGKARLTEPASLLATYSRATAVRSALLLAGFFVGPGGGVGKKEETTLAATQRQALPQLLGNKWLERLKKSHIPFPEKTPQADWPLMIQKLEAHPQFN